MLNLRRLQLLVELRRLGTIAAVGQALHYSPSGVSQQLATLEDETGVTLLERVGRRVRLTRAGEILCDNAVIMLEQAERTEAALAEVQTKATGQVKIAAFQTFNIAILPNLIRNLAEQQIEVIASQLEPEAALPALLNHEFDVAIAEGYGDHQPATTRDLRTLAVMKDPLYLAIPKNMTGTVTEIADTAAMPWVMEPDDSLSRRWAVSRCREAGFEPRVRYQTNDLLTHVALIKSGHAVGFLPALIKACTALDNVTLLTLDSPFRRVKVITRAQSIHYPAVVTTVEEIRALSQHHSGRDISF
ncbi:LysR family transcriptional regulator [Ornithinimicrobium cryptoxanthini]|uniref:LysR family transcriptional regulator n=1 Tax=Ornithinimicrobium cryptoxanthini TaxID=2934161 RepID=A0ABY4YMC3_9MICO|nr:LysR family transcriptional regulator [Ornithinimicrobium cryptoxanthini]USQ77834.1 LysR family transcriptional regulator [Ornithinimicrobium cryptoxanthini]